MATLLLAVLALLLFAVAMRAVDEILFPDEIRSDEIRPW